MKKILVLCLGLSLTACSSPAHHKQAVMYNPETKDTKECKIDPWATWQWEYKSNLAECVIAYEKIGYQRIDH